MTGHSLGASIASLVALHCRAWCPGAALLPTVQQPAHSVSRGDPWQVLGSTGTEAGAQRIVCPRPGVKVWSFNPPGGMVTAGLAHALEPLATSVVVGKDAISRTSSLTFQRLVDQVRAA